MKVYVVTQSDLHADYVIKVYSNKECAETFVKLKNKNDEKHTYYVNKFEVE